MDSFSINDIDLIVPPNETKHFISTLNKSSILDYKVSLKSSSNTTSRFILNNLWNEHTEEFNKLNLNRTLPDNKSHAKTWTSSLSKFQNPEILFTQNTSCENKCTDSRSICHGLNEFLETYNKETDSNTQQYTKYGAATNKCYIDLDNIKNNQTDTPKVTAYKPRFGKQKSIPKIKTLMATNAGTESLSQTSTTDLSSFAAKESQKYDEDKAHNSNVAKITFKSARETLLGTNPALKRSLGASRKAQSKFISPMISYDKQEESEPSVFDERLKNIDPKMIELIENEIIDKNVPIEWEDIAGLEMAKSVIQEAVVWPLLRPDIFTGLRRPPKGILLFGPPGTGKTLIGKCVASQCRATFFSISASSLTSKWIGDGEKMVRALFAVARCHQPAVIFIDEIDSLLTQRSDGEHEATRRIKTEFLVQFDGAATAEEDRLLIVGATNRPQELDEAARRRLVKRLYVPLPDFNARCQIITNLLKNERNDIKGHDIHAIATSTDGYSGADMKSVCSEAAMGPIRSVPFSQMINIETDKVRPMNVTDFEAALQRVRPSVSKDDLGQYEKWNKTYGQGF